MGELVRGAYKWGNLSGGLISGGTYPGAYKWGNLSGGLISGGTCPGGL